MTCRPFSQNCKASLSMHITPVLDQLHWLPIKFGMDFQVLLFVFKALNRFEPNYLSNLLSPYCHSRPLRSSWGVWVP